jgi:hypothetical protein
VRLSAGRQGHSIPKLRKEIFLGLERNTAYRASLRAPHKLGRFCGTGGCTALKDRAVSSGEQHQQKEVRKKEKVTMPKPNQHETDDQEKPRIVGAVIYLFKPEPAAMKRGQDSGVPPLAVQRKLCRYEAAERGARVIGEFADVVGPHSSARPGFRRALDAARRQRLNLLIVITMDEVRIGTVDSFEAIVRPSLAGTETPQDGGD